MQSRFRYMHINGTKIAEEILMGLGRLPKPHKRMVAVLIGNDVASASFLKRKAAIAASLGVGFELVSFSGIEPQQDIENAIRSFAGDVSVGGIILQLPIPASYNRDALIAAIGIDKDVDNLSGRAEVASPSVLVVQEILASCGKKITDFKVIRIIGNGFLIGAPIARWCMDAGVSYQIADIETPDLHNFVRDADLVISGVGSAGLIAVDWLQDNAGVIDFGFPADFDQAALVHNSERLGFYTPTPFGTGPILIAQLFKNFYIAHGG